MRDDDLILPVNFVPSVDEFLDGLQIKPSGLAAQLFTSVYKQFFVWSKDLRDEYEKFYCVEYRTIVEYLELAHEIYLEPHELEKKHILKIKSPSGVVDQMYDDHSLDIVIDCIRTLEATREN